MLRDYQESAISEILKFEKLRQLLHLPTGAGKTVVFCEIIKRLPSLKSLVVVHGKSLIEQASERLSREGIEHGVIMGDHAGRDDSKKVQVCSVDTLSRRNLSPPADLIVIDEAHQATTNSYHKFLSNYEDKKILAVTATPFTEKPLSHLAEKVISPTTVKKLTEEGYLAPLKYYSPSEPDLANVGIRGMDYEHESLANEMNRPHLIGSILHEYLKHADGTPTLIFAVNIAHAIAIKENFASLNKRVSLVTADTPLHVRREYINEKGIIVNVGVFSTGIDIPHLKTIILARPTKSYNLYIQMLGRGTRPSPGKSHCLVLDHSGNVKTHGFIDDERKIFLGKKKEPVEQTFISTCKKCFAVFYVNEKCPLCGTKNEQVEKERKLKRVDGVLTEIIELSEIDKARIYLNQLKKERKERGHKRGWVFYKMKDKFPEWIVEELCPKRVIPDWVRMKYIKK